MDHRRSPIPLLLTLAALAAILGHFLYHTPLNLGAALQSIPDQFTGDWNFPTHAAMGLLTLVVMWFAAAGVGFLILELTGASRSLPSLWQRYVLGVLTGWVVLGLSTLAVGLLGFCNRLGLGALLLITAAFGVLGWSAIFRNLRATEAARATEEFQISGWILALAILLLAIAVPYALTPSVESDELRYHLAAPEAYLEAGRIFYLPHQAFTNFPFLIEMLFTMAMALQGAEAAKMVHLSFLETSAILTALTAFLLIRVWSRGSGFARSPAARAIAAASGVAFAAIPTSTILACWAFVDIATVAYFLALAYVGALALVKRTAPPAWLLGVMAAGAIGTKYLMLPMTAAVALFLLIFLVTRAQHRGRAAGPAFRYVLGACAVAAALAAPWFVKNLVWTGNPVYPLAYGIFHGGEWSELNAAFYSAKAAEKGFNYADLSLPDGYTLPELTPAAAHLVEFIISPITTSLAWERFENNILGPLPLMAMALAAAGALLWWFTRKERRPSRASPLLIGWLGVLVVTSWTLWFFTYQSNRMLLPALALIFAAASGGAALLVCRIAEPTTQRRALVVLAALVAAGALHSWTKTAVSIIGDKPAHPIPLALGFGSREEYLSRAIAYYEPAQWLTERLTDGKKALLVGEHRTLYFSNAVVASDWFDTPQPLPLIRATNDNEELFAKLAADNVRYVFFNVGELQKYASAYFAPRFTPLEFARFQAFMNDPRLNLIRNDLRNGVRILEILASPSTDQRK